MSRDEVKQAWKKVGDEFSALGLKLELHFEEERSDDDQETTAMVKRLVDLVEDAFESVAEAAKDEAVRDDVRRAAGAFADAITVTVGEAGEEIRSRVPGDKAD